MKKFSRDQESSQEPSKISKKTRLKSLENGLSSRKEIEQYSKALPWFQNDQEKIEFLELGSFEARQKWMSEINFSSRPQQIQQQMKDILDSEDIALGMPQALVKKSWGEPESVEVSGNPVFRNERWKYSKYVSSQEGFKSEKKVVYFEGGKVVGWEIE